MSGVLQSIIMSSKSTALPITYVNVASNFLSSSGTSLTINKPTDTADGDLMIMFIGGAFSGSQTWTFPSGWTAISGFTGGSGPALGIAYKVASSEGSSYTTTGTNSNRYSGHIVTYRNAAYDVASTRSTTLIAPSVTTSAANSLIIAVYMTNTGTVNTNPDQIPDGMTLSYFDNNGTTPNYMTCVESLEFAGATGTREAGSPSSGTINSAIIAIKPV